jgi:glycosyltransferase involved in cell wall biosynthesis
MRRLLALSWSMPPVVVPRSIQVSRLLAALAEFDWQTDVVCVDPESLREGTNLDEGLNRPAGGKVKKYPVPSLEDWVPVRILNRLFPALAILPDTKWVWKNAAWRKLNALSVSKTYDAFISFGQPWTDHLSGLQFKAEHNIPWIAHFSDPWADNPFVKTNGWVMKKRLEMEESVIRSADAILFVSEETANLVMNKYPANWRSKVHVIPHGFELENPAGLAKMHNTVSPVEFVYTGNFYSSRTPDTLLEAASRLLDDPDCAGQFIIRFVGPILPEYPEKAVRMGLEECVRFEGPVSFTASQEFCLQADVLLVIDAPSETPSVFLPSKLVDYLAFNKPVLGITPPEGASANLIRRLGCPVVDPLDVDGITKVLAGFIKAGKNGVIPLPDVFQQTAAEYEISHAAAKLNDLLISLAG